jgi:CHAD domain-containing protein
MPLRRPLEPLRAYLITHYEGEQRRLAEALDSEALGRMRGDWRAFLESRVEPEPEAEHALLPIKAIADDRIWRMCRRVRKEGRAITPQSPAEDMHELRKSCKKLRYLMEFFQSLYAADEIKGVIRLMKTLLDNLGAFQDLAVQAAHLRELAVGMREAQQADTDTLLAMGALIGQLLARQEQARADFADTFAGFLADDAQALMRALFKPKDPLPARPSPDPGEESAA